jgi:hypothetical protein
MSVALLRLSDGRLAYMRPVKDAPLADIVAETIAVCKRDGMPGWDNVEFLAEVEDEAIPIDTLNVRYRDAWDWTTDEPTIDINMDKAREICLALLRDERNKQLAKLDVEELRASTVKERNEVRAEKERLRDLPATISPQLESAATLEELEKLRKI